MFAKVTIEYNGKIYESDKTEFNEKEPVEMDLLEQLETQTRNIVTGKCTYFKMVNEGKETFFPADVLKKSIISIVKTDI